MDLHLHDKIVIITGGSSGIGAGISEAFAREGARVCFTYHSTNPGSVKRAQDLKEKLDAKYSSDCYFAPVDCSKEDEISALFDMVEKHFGGPVQILCNNAGLTGPSGTMPDIATETWNAFLQNHVTNYFLMSREFCKRIIPKKLPGWIVNTLSKASFTSTTKGSLCVMANKHAELGLTRSMAVDLTDYNIQVNGIVPGFVRNSRPGDPKREANRVQRVPIHRIAEPLEIGNIAVFLASDQCQLSVGAAVDATGGLLLGF